MSPPSPRRRPRLAAVLAGLALAAPTCGFAQVLVDWTSGPGQLGLGYPVPVPVDTPLPFDGFRSYSGLHARLQDLADQDPALDAVVIGQTLRGRDIWLYRVGGAGRPDVDGRPRPTLLFNGGIHAREWQSPEVVTGLIEFLAGAGDRHWIDFLREHVAIAAIPVLNVDGFLQTQRYPRSNWIGADPTSPQSWPRDGRMRRKNLRDADEDLATVGDHLRGVDLNRNSAPFWPGPVINLNPAGLTHSGVGPASEPEMQALHAAGALLADGSLRFYADLHSFGRVLFTVDTGDAGRLAVQREVLAMASAHHVTLPGAKYYIESPEPAGSGIGTTAEHFAYSYGVPSLTWELEPANGAVEYGGLGSNGHDGFILPESQIRRVRENMAQTLAAIAYHMAGPPHLVALDVVDAASGHLVLDRRWAPADSATGARALLRRDLQALVPGRDYRLRLGFSKPMRWPAAGGGVQAFPGRPDSTLALSLVLRAGDTPVAAELGAPQWLDVGMPGPFRPLRYRYDSVVVDLRIEDTPAMRPLLEQAAAGDGLALSVHVQDMTGRALDADPATPAGFVYGAWTGYDGPDGPGDVGGADSSQRLPVAFADGPSFAIDPGHTATWYDPTRSGEGFLLEILPGGQALAYWFTYDEDGDQRWLVGQGPVVGNQVHIDALYLTTGGRFGPGFDPGAVVRTAVGSGRFWFHDCDHGWFDFDALGQRGRFALQRTSRTQGVDCDPAAPAAGPWAGQSGSWYDPSHSGEGYALQWMTNGDAIVTWYSFDPEGNPYWMLGVGSRQGDDLVFPDLHTTRGGRFGAGFDPTQVERLLWGELRLRLACAAGASGYASVRPGFGTGQLDLVRLTRPLGISCPPP